METILLHPQLLEGTEYNLLRQNPDRGWRLETYLTLGSNTVMFKPGETPLGFLDAQRALYRDAPVSLVQFYVYLTEYCKKPLDEKAFNQLNAYLEALRERGLRAVLRFAYEFETDRKIGPTSHRIYSHLKQIQKWFAENDALVRETVAVVQAGIIGVWGEWHTARFMHNQKKVLLKICDTVPSYLPVQVRMQLFKDKIRSMPQAKRVGYHDDFLVGAYHKWNAPAGAPNTQAFKAFTEESQYTYNDGEMPWGRDKTHQDGFIDGCEMMTACAQRSLSTLSLVHNYIEEDGQYNALRWQKEMLRAVRVRELGCPCTAAYFTENGAELARSVFDYLTDHLGYQIAVREIAVADSQDGGQTVTVKLSNNGFALPYGFIDLHLHLFDKDGSVRTYPFTDFAPEKLTGGKTASFTVSCDCRNIEKIGISLQKESTKATVRFANRGEYREGIQIFPLKNEIK